MDRNEPKYLYFKFFNHIYTVVKSMSYGRKKLGGGMERNLPDFSILPDLSKKFSVQTGGGRGGGVEDEKKIRDVLYIIYYILL